MRFYSIICAETLTVINIILAGVPGVSQVNKKIMIPSLYISSLRFYSLSSFSLPLPGLYLPSPYSNIFISSFSSCHSWVSSLFSLPPSLILPAVSTAPWPQSLPHIVSDLFRTLYFHPCVVDDNYLPPIFEKRREVLFWGLSLYLPSKHTFCLISRLLLKLAF